jgi:hypothetical protein
MNRGSTRQSVLCAVSASPECLMNRGELHRLRTGSPAHQPRPRGSDSTFPSDSAAQRLTRQMPYSCIWCIQSSSTSVRFLIPVVWRGGCRWRSAGALSWPQRTARVAGLNTGQVWNLCVVSLFAALAAQRMLLVALNWAICAIIPHGCWGWPWFIIRCWRPRALAGVVSAAICLRAGSKLPFRGTQPMCWPRRGAGAGLRATGRAAGRFGLRNRDRRFAGR